MKYSIAEAGLDILGAKNSSDVILSFRRFIEEFQIDSFTTGEIDIIHRRRTVFHGVEWSKAWREYYLQSGLAAENPVLLALDQLRGPLTWHEIGAICAERGEECRELGDLAAAGWADGLVIPLPRGGTHFGLVSLISKERQIDRQAKAELVPIAALMQQRLRDLVPREGFRLPPAGLTSQELACLAKLAEGLSDIRAGEALELAGSAVHSLIESAKRKLDAANRAQLVAIAVRHAIIAT